VEKGNKSMIGNYIRQVRKSKGIGSRELARKINKAETYISQLERGLIKKPDYATTKILLETLEVPSNTIEEILLGYEVPIGEVIQIKNKLTSQVEFETKCKSDAEEIVNLINNLPERTQEIIKSKLFK
jgi:transcriptional regulator with XRE-family HTH domain